MTGPANGTVPVGPMLSMYDPIHVGSDEFGQPFYIRLIYKNLLAAGEPGGGKSGLLNTVAAHAALSSGSRMVLFDAKDVEPGMWDQTADEFVGPDIGRAIIESCEELRSPLIIQCYEPNLEYRGADYAGQLIRTRIGF